ncbi:MAG: molybdopterin-dependent oxidoreductase [Candidatus Eisenbacteria bacterium]|nr:molybdopterin-dependent oxidoreductase [Candidatus Eisenbacteria bacterium]
MVVAVAAAPAAACMPARAPGTRVVGGRMGQSFHAIGRPHRRVDSLGKVTGRARFAADLDATGMLWGGVLLARRPHARIAAVETSRAREIPGVHAVLTAADLPHAKLFGVVIRNQPVLAEDRVRHYGDAVAMVAADSRSLLQRALDLVRVEYEDLPAVFDPEEAMGPGAPHVHEPGNVLTHHRLRRGDVQHGFAAAKEVLSRTYRTQHVDHAYLEPECVLAEMTGDGGVRVTGSIQNLFSTRKSLADVMGLDLARVTVKQATLGGSFGGKDEVMTQMSCRAALLARATGRPVKILNTREQSLLESYKRHPYVLHYKVGADAGGRLTALEARIVADAGAYASMSPFVTWRSAVQAAGPYLCENVATDVRAVYTNNVYTGAMRGFGSPQVNFAVEAIIDELAGRLGLDPLEMRMRNALTRGDTTPTGQRLDHEVAVREVLERAAASGGWRRRADIERENAARGDGRRRGVGLACCYRGVSLGAEGTDAAGALVSVQSDGSILVSAGFSDMGQGVASALSLIVAEVLSVGTERIKFFKVHTGRVPDSGPTVASRSTIMGGNAVKKAAESVRETLLDVAGGMLKLDRSRLRMIRGAVADEASGSSAAFDEVVARAYALGRPLIGLGWHKAPPTTWDEKTGSGDAYFTFVYSANVAEVDVDMETGRVRLVRVTAVHDVGRAISPAMIRSQVCGGVAMGQGYALLERYPLAQGVPAAQNLDTYLLVTALDMPEVDPVLVENPDPAGPFGAKSVGEPATEITAPAVINAIAHATGRRITALPADLEMVLLGRHLRPDAPVEETGP